MTTGLFQQIIETMTSELAFNCAVKGTCPVVVVIVVSSVDNRNQPP